MILVIKVPRRKVFGPKLARTRSLKSSFPRRRRRRRTLGQLRQMSNQLRRRRRLMSIAESNSSSQSLLQKPRRNSKRRIRKWIKNLQTKILRLLRKRQNVDVDLPGE